MKIAHVVSTFPPYHGGMGNVACALHEELMKRGHDSIVITPRRDRPMKRDGVVRLRPWIAFRNSAFIPQLVRHLSDREVVHLHYPFYGGAEAVSFFKWWNPHIKLVLTYHMDNVGAGPVALFFSCYEKVAQERILKTADVVIASSMDYARNSQLANCASLKIEELPFGVSTDFNPGLRARTDSEPFRILFVGGLDKAHYFKGLPVLIEALGICKGRVALHVIGTGDLLPMYKDLARKHQVDRLISFHGSLPREQLIQAYQNSDVTILPSVDRSESFGLVLLESMACGTPVITSDLPGVRTVARHMKEGLVVSPGDAIGLAGAIDLLAADEGLRCQLGKQAQARVEGCYRWPVIIDRLEAIYRTES